jgi:hypothetical protein
MSRAAARVNILFGENNECADDVHGDVEAVFGLAGTTVPRAAGSQLRSRE